jgi:hypothetical protein
MGLAVLHDRFERDDLALRLERRLYRRRRLVDVELLFNDIDLAGGVDHQVARAAVDECLELVHRLAVLLLAGDPLDRRPLRFRLDRGPDGGRQFAQLRFLVGKCHARHQHDDDRCESGALHTCSPLSQKWKPAES